MPWSVWPLRLTLTVHAAMAVAQPVLAGEFLGGDYDAIGRHGTNASLLAAVLLACGAAALVHAVARGPRWPVAALVVLFAAETLQIGFGYSRSLAVHVPLGVAIVATAVALAVWSWTGSATRRRPRRTRRLRRGHQTTGSPR